MIAPEACLAAQDSCSRYMRTEAAPLSTAPRSAQQDCYHGYPASLCISASSNVHVQGKIVRVTITRLCLTIGQGMPKGQSGTTLAHDSSRVRILELLKETSVACISL